MHVLKTHLMVYATVQYAYALLVGTREILVRICHRVVHPGPPGARERIKIGFISVALWLCGLNAFWPQRHGDTEKELIVKT